MCCGCYKDFGSPTIDNDRVRAAVRTIREVYDYSCVGGNLHIYLDDWNIGWDTPEGALEEMGRSIDENVHEADAAQMEAERRCAGLFAGLSEDEQASALGLHDGCWGDRREPDNPAGDPADDLPGKRVNEVNPSDLPGLDAAPVARPFGVMIRTLPSGIAITGED